MEPMTNQEIIDKTVEFVKSGFTAAEGGHDWWHIERVWKTALTIAKSESVLPELSIMADILVANYTIHL